MLIWIKFQSLLSGWVISGFNLLLGKVLFEPDLKHKP